MKYNEFFYNIVDQDELTNWQIKNLCDIGNISLSLDTINSDNDITDPYLKFIQKEENKKCIEIDCSKYSDILELLWKILTELNLPTYGIGGNGNIQDDIDSFYMILACPVEYYTPEQKKIHYILVLRNLSKLQIKGYAEEDNELLKEVIEKFISKAPSNFEEYNVRLDTFVIKE